MKKLKKILGSRYLATAFYSLCTGVGVYLASEELNTFDNSKNAIVFLVGALAIYIFRITNFWIVSKLRESNQLAILDQSKNPIKFVNIIVYPTLHIIIVFILGINAFNSLLALGIILLIMNLFSIQNVSESSFGNENFDELRAHVAFDIQKLTLLFTIIIVLFNAANENAHDPLLYALILGISVFITKFFIAVKNDKFNPRTALASFLMAIGSFITFFLIAKYKFEGVLTSSLFLYIILLISVALVQNFLQKTLSLNKIFNYIFSAALAIGIYFLL